MKRNNLSRGIWILLVCLLLVGCETAGESCRRACWDADLDFHAYDAPIIAGDAVQSPGVCECEKADKVVKLW